MPLVTWLLMPPFRPIYLTKRQGSSSAKWGPNAGYAWADYAWADYAWAGYARAAKLWKSSLAKTSSMQSIEVDFEGK